MIDHNRSLTGDDLSDFVNQKLFPYLHGFKHRASGPLTILDEIAALDAESAKVLRTIRGLL